MGLGVALQINPVGIRHHHRWERLCLIEIASMASEMEGSGGGRVRKPCVDCGKSHLELFELAVGALDSVLDIIERWMQYCDTVLV